MAEEHRHPRLKALLLLLTLLLTLLLSLLLELVPVVLSVPHDGQLQADPHGVHTVLLAQPNVIGLQAPHAANNDVSHLGGSGFGTQRRTSF